MVAVGEQVTPLFGHAFRPLNPLRLAVGLEVYVSKKAESITAECPLWVMIGRILPQARNFRYGRKAEVHLCNTEVGLRLDHAINRFGNDFRFTLNNRH